MKDDDKSNSDKCNETGWTFTNVQVFGDFDDGVIVGKGSSASMNNVHVNGSKENGFLVHPEADIHADGISAINCGTGFNIDANTKTSASAGIGFGVNSKPKPKPKPKPIFVIHKPEIELFSWTAHMLKFPADINPRNIFTVIHHITKQPKPKRYDAIHSASFSSLVNANIPQSRNLNFKLLLLANDFDETRTMQDIIIPILYLWD